MADETTCAPAAEVRDVHHRFGQIPALRGIDLRIPRDRIFGLTGPDGAGKTTLMRLLCGLLLPEAGSLRIFGDDPIRQTDRVRRQLGYMPQRFALYPDLSVEENLHFYADLFGVSATERPERLERLLAFSRLAAFVRRRAGQLSGGMRQKLALCSALIHRPRLLLLDEPTTGVDPIARRELWEMLRQIVAQGTTILVATPYMEEAARCDSVALMAEGRLLAEGSPDALLAEYPWQLIAVRTSRPLQAGRLVADLPGAAGAHALGDRVHVATADPAALLPHLRERLERGGIPVERIAATRPTLDDLFVALFPARRTEDSDRTPEAQGAPHGR
ncbi:MAG: ATP-binding cassette domain-containing protein [Candidatus Eisenbacteria bacterium]|nr:ATP-binding cassette domain-containing protein [Candidatus Eisenbacteria bacterium]